MFYWSQQRLRSFEMSERTHGAHVTWLGRRQGRAHEVSVRGRPPAAALLLPVPAARPGAGGRGASAVGLSACTSFLKLWFFPLVSAHDGKHAQAVPVEENCSLIYVESSC